jgi:flagellar biosynthesis/type III secretory pathway protein FliH
MSLAKQTLEALSQDPDVRRLAREREDSRALYQIDLATSKRLGRAEGLREGLREGKAEGKAEGLREGKAKLLLEQLGERFGPPSDATRARIASATSEQLDAWAKRILTAATLDDVLAPPPSRK